MTWRTLQTSGLLALTFGLYSCATTETYSPVQLPAFAGAYFSDCTGKDGSVSMELFSEGKVEQIFDADWTADANGDFGLASYSPLGQTLFQLDFVHKSQTLKTTGKSFANLENLAVGDRRLVEYNGHSIGLKTDEIACLLNHKLPQRWTQKIVSHDETAENIEYVIVDSKRTIRLSLAKHGNRSEVFWKANINWSLYMGLKKLQLSVRLLRDEPALVLHSDQFEKVDLRIVSQEE
ncbi:MAG: hypothetical protein H7249_11885 [Chitinophagaceae bacterium]|nr:hypothetical protein [Oligoflexus sp.]